MATLWKKAAGFRFPYPKWARTSTPKNLLFLEALLEKYLHIHETVNNTLYVTPRGMRMPYKKTLDNLEENMKFIEGQLEQALHEHEATTTTTEGTTGRLPINVGGFEDTIIDTNPEDEPWWLDTVSLGSPVGQIVSGGAQQGTKYFQVTAPGPSNLSLNCFDTGTSAAPFQFVDDPVITISGHSRGTTANTGERMFLVLRTYDENDSFLGDFTLEPDLHTASDTWTAFSFEQRLTELQGASGNETGVQPIFFFVVSGAGNSGDMGLDNVAINEETEVESALTLFTNHKGFRFPYSWETEQQRRMNMNHLETQITKFLHKHEVVA